MKKKSIAVGLTIDQFNGIKPSTLLKVVKKLGLEFVELTSSAFDDLNSCKKIIGNMKAGLHLPNIHDKGYDFSCRDRKTEIDHLINLINDNHQELNITYCLTHPPECDSISEKEKSIPFKMGGYFYYTIASKNTNYPELYRKKDTIGSNGKLILDIPKLAKNSEYYAIASFKASPDDKILAYLEDKTGTGRFYYLFKNLQTNKYLQDTLFNANNLIWTGKENVIIYSIKDSLNRIYQVNLHVLNSHQSSDKVLFYEKPTFTSSNLR